MQEYWKKASKHRMLLTKIQTSRPNIDSSQITEVLIQYASEARAYRVFQPSVEGCDWGPHPEGGEAPEGWGPKSHPDTRGQKPYTHERERVYCHYLSKADCHKHLYLHYILIIRRYILIIRNYLSIIRSQMLIIWSHILNRSRISIIKHIILIIRS